MICTFVLIVITVGLAYSHGVFRGSKQRSLSILCTTMDGLDISLTCYKEAKPSQVPCGRSRREQREERRPRMWREGSCLHAGKWRQHVQDEQVQLCMKEWLYSWRRLMPGTCRVLTSQAWHTIQQLTGHSIHDTAPTTSLTSSSSSTMCAT